MPVRIQRESRSPSAGSPCRFARGGPGRLRNALPRALGRRRRAPAPAVQADRARQLGSEARDLLLGGLGELDPSGRLRGVELLAQLLESPAIRRPRAVVEHLASVVRRRDVKSRCVEIGRRRRSSSSRWRAKPPTRSRAWNSVVGWRSRWARYAKPFESFSRRGDPSSRPSSTRRLSGRRPASATSAARP